MIQTSVSIPTPPPSNIARNLAHIAQGFVITIEDAMLSFANNCATTI